MRRSMPACFVTFTCILFLPTMGCKLFNTPPTCDGTYWGIENADPTFRGNQGGSTPTAFAFLAILVSDADGQGDIVLIRVSGPDGSPVWTLKDAGAGVDHYNESGEYWGGWGYYSASSPHTLPLGTYSVYIKDSVDHEVNSSFRVGRPGGRLGYETFLFTEDYTGSTTDGEPMLPRPAAVTGTTGGESLTITFEATSTDVFNGFVWFFDSAGNYITTTGFFRDSINNGLGLMYDNALTLTAGDLDLGSFRFSDIAGFHVVLTDGQQYYPRSVSYDHRSVSAYVTF